MIKLSKVYNKRFTSLQVSSYFSNINGFSTNNIQGYKLLSSNFSDDLKLQIN